MRIGGGTRLKIYEAMAARVPVVSTTVGAEGLDIHHPDDIRLADTPEAFAAACTELLARRRVAAAPGGRGLGHGGRAFLLGTRGRMLRARPG